MKNNIFIKILKFICLVVGMSLIHQYLPYGNILNLGITLVALWKLANG